LTTLVDQRWITEDGGLFEVNKVNIPAEQGFQLSVSQVVDQNVDHLLTQGQQGQQSTDQWFQPFVDPDVDLLTRSGNKNLDDSQCLTEDQLIGLIDLIASDPKAFRNEASMLGESQRLQLIKEMPCAKEMLSC
jgi:hypothetical protein